MASRRVSILLLSALLGLNPGAYSADLDDPSPGSANLSSPSVVFSPANVAWRKQMEEGNFACRLAADGKYAESNAIFERCIEKVGRQNPHSSVFFVYRGLSYLSQNEPQKALDDFNAAYKLVPTSDAEIKNYKSWPIDLQAIVKICIRGKYFADYLLRKYEEAADSELKLCVLIPKTASQSRIDAAILYVFANKTDRALKEAQDARIADPTSKAEADEVIKLCKEIASFDDSQRKVLEAEFDKKIQETMVPLLHGMMHAVVGSAAFHQAGASGVNSTHDSAVHTAAAGSRVPSTSSFVHQNASSVTPSEAYVEGPITKCCRALSEQLKSSWTALPDLIDFMNMDVEIDNDGKIIDVQVPKDSSKYSELLKKAAVLRLRGLKDLQSVSPDLKFPLWLTVSLSNKPEKLYTSLRDIDFTSYMSEMQKRIKSGWTPPHLASSASLAVKFKIDAKGDVSDLHVSKSTGNDVNDKAGLAAVNAACPLSPLPDGAPSPVDIEFKFDYNVLNAPNKTASKPAGGALRDRVVTEENQSQIWEELKNSPDVSLEQYKLLLFNSPKTKGSGEPQLTLGKTVGEILDQQIKADADSKTEFDREQMLLDDAAEAKNPLLKLVKVEVLNATYKIMPPKDRSGDSMQDICWLTLTLRASNPGLQDLRKYHGVIDFKSGADYVTDVTIVREEGIKAGETKTFTQTFSDDELNRGWRILAGSDLSSLRIRWKPWKITMSDGKQIEGSLE